MEKPLSRAGAVLNGGKSKTKQGEWRAIFVWWRNGLLWGSKSSALILPVRN